MARGSNPARKNDLALLLARTGPSVLALLLTAGAVAAASAGSALRREEGDADGVPYVLLADGAAADAGALLVLAPGDRPAGAAPHAAAGDADLVYGDLLSAGWRVVATDYRRGGSTPDAAADDLLDLLSHLVRTHGAVQRIVVAGSSLGAAAGVRLAEREAVLQRDPGVRRSFAVAGVVACGLPDLGDRDAADEPWSHDSGVPVLLISNRDEMAAAADYAAAAARGAVAPAPWRVERDGHVNLSRAERAAAVMALIGWLDGGDRPPGTPAQPHDATMAAPPPAAAGQTVPGGLRGLVAAVDPAYGNLDTNLTAADLARLGLARGDVGGVRCDGPARRIRIGATYADVAPGELVAFVTADGVVRVAVNLGSAADLLQARAGGVIELLREAPTR